MKGILLVFLLGFAVAINSATLESFQGEDILTVDEMYDAISGNMPSKTAFANAYEGYLSLKKDGELSNSKEILTVVDFTLSSNKERLWVIDLAKKEVLMHLLVAHGKNSGWEFANQFSNRPGSNQSSLGFYVTGETYQGKHGLSLRLDGMEKGINDKARDRAVVMHGADYVSQEFIDKYGRLGRSFGCPSIEMDVHDKIINKIKDKTCLFIFHDELYTLNTDKIGK